MTSKTNWDKIITGKEIITVKNLKSKPYITSKERRSALPELIDEGWELIKEYKDSKFVGVKKDKAFFTLFEDKVWTLFAKMGFTHMNADNSFAMSYDYCNPDSTQQIDVFAADDETVLIIECKSSETLKEVPFKTKIEALHGQMEGLRKEALKQFPSHKVKFIWATHNIKMSNADVSRLKEWNIALFDDSVIDYYCELVKHLGSCAKYQLLGNLFENQEIKNMPSEVPAIEGKMGGYTYYSFSIEPERLLKISYILHRNEANRHLMPTYQRIIKKKRLNDVRSFIENGGYFPNSIIVNIDTKGRELQFDRSEMRAPDSISKLGILHLPKKYRSAYIIDGQHRLYGYSESKYAYSNSIPVVAFVDLDRQEQIKLFMDINENQKAVPKVLRDTLNADLLWSSDNYNDRRIALCSKIAQTLGEDISSPLYNRVIIGENENRDFRRISIHAIQDTLKKCNFFSSFNKKNAIIKDGTFDKGDLQQTFDSFYPFLEQALKYIEKNAPEAWLLEDNKEQCGVITINRGIYACLRIIDDIINHLTEHKKINVKTQPINDYIGDVEFYLHPLVDYINQLGFEERRELRGHFGGGGDIRFWRVFQKAINAVHSEFAPDGLLDYWKNQSKTFNDGSFNYIRDIHKAIKSVVIDKLSQSYGSELLRHIPKEVYRKANNDAADRNFDNLDDNVSWEDCITLSQLREIIIYGNNWSELFNELFTLNSQQKLVGGKDAKTEWLNKLNEIQRKFNTPNYSVTESDYELITEAYETFQDYVPVTI